MAPLLFSLAVHRALSNAQTFLRAGEYIFAFLDDVYTIATRERAADITAHVAQKIEEGAGVKPKLGNYALWSRQGGVEPPGVEVFLRGQPRPATPLWKGDLDPAHNGPVILGTPIGRSEFVERDLQERLAQRFLAEITQLPDLRAAWLVLLYCAVPRANNLLRSLPPDQVAACAKAHDEKIWSTFLQIIGYNDWEEDPHLARARAITFLPVVHGGLGLRSSELTAPAAYWAA